MVKVNPKHFFLALLVFFLVIVGIGIRDYHNEKEKNVALIETTLQKTLGLVRSLASDNYIDSLQDSNLTSQEGAALTNKITALAQSQNMLHLYVVFMDSTQTMRYALTDVTTATQPLSAVVANVAQLDTYIKAQQPHLELDDSIGNHTLYIPSTTLKGTRYMLVATTQPISLQKLSQGAIFDTIAKSLLIFLGALPLFLLYRKVFVDTTENLNYTVTTTTHELIQTNEILKDKVEEKTKELIDEGFEDSFTHLPNRHRLVYDMDRSQHGALVILHLQNYHDLSRFFGPLAATPVLQQFAFFLTKRQLNAYRLGRDEFALLIDSQKTENLKNILEDLVEEIQNASFNIEKENVNLHVVLGVSIGENLSLANSDTALNEAIEASSAIVFYNTQANLEDYYQHNLKSAAAIREAYHNGRIMCYYQPIIATKDNKTLGYEALARLIDVNATIVSPDEFLTVAKKTRLYPHITQLIITQACENFKNSSLSFSVHLCALDILDHATARFIEEIIVMTNTARRIIFEISEDDLQKNHRPVSLFIARMKSLGVKISISNFSSSFTDIQQLSQLGIDYLKIDPLLINEVPNNPIYCDAILSIHRIAHAMRAQCIAQHVENTDTLTWLKNNGIEYAQGFLIGKPAPYYAD
jgi:EAL domain-containing protein (putative c-di-GMP-specific phosphodiesterase class I)/GGDEF domain-containing protein